MVVLAWTENQLLGPTDQSVVWSESRPSSPIGGQSSGSDTRSDFGDQYRRPVLGRAGGGNSWHDRHPFAFHTSFLGVLAPRADTTVGASNLGYRVRTRLPWKVYSPNDARVPDSRKPVNSRRRLCRSANLQRSVEPNGKGTSVTRCFRSMTVIKPRILRLILNVDGIAVALREEGVTAE